MVHYRRACVPGGTFFFTVALNDRKANTLVANVAALRKVLDEVRSTRPFHINAMVVLPEHLHAIWTLPEGDADYSARWRSVKAGFVIALRREGFASRPNMKGEHAVWQRRFWEHQIRNDDDMARHVDYVHINPVKHGLVKRVSDWRWSTFHRYVREGILP